MMRVGYVQFNKVGPSGNIFAIMGNAYQVLKAFKMKNKGEEMVKRVKASHSYEEALGIIGEYVHLVESDIVF